MVDVLLVILPAQYAPEYALTTVSEVVFENTMFNVFVKATFLKLLSSKCICHFHEIAFLEQNCRCSIKIPIICSLPNKNVFMPFPVQAMNVAVNL